MSIAPGDFVTPHVKLVRPLGEGGMGLVWVAHHAGLDAEVAVKFVVTEDAADPQTIERFKREAALSAKIKSPHVVKTFDHGVMENGEPYIVMELLEGETLGARLGRTPRLPPRDVAYVIAQTARVLDEAHGLGVVHRDIKPDNVFLLASDYLFVKVLDFGIAKQTQKLDVASVTDTGAIVGTPEYMSPEQLLSPKSADWRSDSWALAVLAYRALTGTAPFKGETLPSLSLNIVGSRFTPPSELVPELSPAVDAWFVRAFHRDSQARFQSVIALAETLAHALGLADAIPSTDRDYTASEPSSSKREGSGSGTLASAKSEARPSLLATPQIGVETAADDPNAIPKTARSDTPPEGAELTPQGRRRGPVVIEIDRPRSTPRPRSSLQPTPTSVRLDEAQGPQQGRLKLAGALIVVALSAAAAAFTLRGSDPGPSLLPSAASSGLAEQVWSDEEDTVAPRRPPPKAAPAEPPVPTPAPPPPAEPVRPASGKLPAPPRPQPPVPQPTPTPSAAPKNLDHCYIMEPDGTLTVKPECMRRP